jgi:DNA-binding transcriptional LysR family regulator
MEFRQLRYFTMVARELNFTRAAEKLRVAQPALSRQVRQLEEELGVRLFVRDKRHVELTTRGEAFLAEAEAILKQSERAMLLARSNRVALRLGYVWGLFHTMVPEALQRLRVLAPEVAVNLFDLSAAQQSRALAANKLDAGFIGFALEADSARLEKRRVGETRFVIALPEQHPLAVTKKIDLRQLAGEVFLTISDEHFPGASRIISEACRAANFQPRTLQTPERGHTILSLVAAGCGLALLPDTLAALPHAGVVFRAPLEPLRADLFLAWRADLDRELLQPLIAATEPSPPLQPL